MISAIPPLQTDRLELEPLTESHAQSMYQVLNDEALHHFTGGAPPESSTALRRRYQQLAGGRSPDSSELWWNWVLRLRDSTTLIGYVQATFRGADTGVDLAWVIGQPWQRRRFAIEAATCVATWLRQAGIHHITAHVHPDHIASNKVARAIRLDPTTEIVDGEVTWRWSTADRAGPSGEIS